MKMKWARGHLVTCCILFFLSTRLAYGQAAPKVTVDGSKETQRLLATSIRIDCGEGLVFDVPTSKIRRISASMSLWSIHTATGVLHGKILASGFTLKSRHGVTTRPLSEFHELIFVDADPVDGLTPEELQKAEGGGVPAAEIPDIPAVNQPGQAAALELTASIAELIPAPNLSWIYILNVSDGKLQRIDTKSQSLDTASVDLVSGTLAVCLSPDGKTFYTAATMPVVEPGANSDVPLPGKKPGVKPGGKPGAKPVLPPKGKKPILGKIQVIDTMRFAVVKTIEVETHPLDLAADDKGRVFLVGVESSGVPRVHILDTGRAAVVAKCDSPASSYGSIKLHPDQKRLYFTGDSEILGLRISGDLKELTEASGSRGLRRSQDPCGPFRITPDGKFLIAFDGTVLRLAQNPNDDLQVYRGLPAHFAGLVDETSNSYLLVDHRGVLHVYTLPTFTESHSLPLNCAVYRMAFDPGHKTLYCAVDDRAVVGEEIRKSRQQAVGLGVGKIRKFTLDFMSASTEGK